MPSRARKVLSRLVESAADVSRPARHAPGVVRDEALLLRSGIFDREWFEAQCGRTFANDLLAVRHYLAARRGLGYSPHPLLEPEFVQASLGSDRLPGDPGVAYLAQPRVRAASAPHPMFDVDRAVRDLRASGAAKPARTDAFVTWVRHAAPDTPVPVPGWSAEVSWGELRAHLLGSMARWDAHRATLRGAAPVRQLPALSAAARRALQPGSVESDVAAQPLVSVVMATWNRAPSLRPAIASVLAQRWRHLELVVVDDGSSDDTEAVVTGMAHFDDRVRYVRLPRSGVCAARNAGLAVATGRYVAFLDSDNTWRPEFLLAVVPAMEQAGWEMAYGALQINDGSHVTYRASEATHQNLLIANCLDLNVLVVTRELVERVGGFDETLRRAVDYDLVLKLSARAEPHLVGIVGADYSEDADDASRISNSEPKTWNAYVRGRQLVDMRDIATQTRTPGLVSVVVPIGREMARLTDWVRLLEPPAVADGLDVELVVVGLTRRSQYSILSACGRDRAVTIMPHMTRDGLALLTNLGAAASSGELLLLARPNAVVDRSALAPLVAALDDPTVAVVQPLVERSDMAVATAGAVFSPASLHPSPLLEDFPSSDAVRLGTVVLPAALSPVVMVRARDFGVLEGLNPLFGNTFSEVDLSLRAQDQGVGSTLLVPGSIVTARSQNRAGFEHDSAQSTRLLTDRWHHPPPGSDALWAAAGFEVTGYAPYKLGGTQQKWGTTWGLTPRVRRPTPVQVREGVPRLRWTIDTAAPSGPTGAAWGDRHFARSLAVALEAHGQEVAIDHREARTRATRLHDDVVLVLRGLDEVVLQPHPVTLLWVISHPDLVTGWEAARYDAVFAASIAWSATRSAEWGIPVEPLLQCTDPRLFHPDRGLVDCGPAVLFVGNSRKLYRPVLRRAIAAGADVAVYGGGWKPFIDDKFVKAAHVANTELGALYGSAGLVLNDHWDDMRREGFLSNRLFDAVACGARVVSDDVDGLREVFGDAVAVCESQEEMDRLVRAPYLETFPDQDARRERALQVVAEHSFDARAAQLVESAVRLRQRVVPTGLTARDPFSGQRRW